MSEPPGSSQDAGRDPDAGEPIAELAGLGEEPSDRFVTGVMDGINRRQIGTQLAEVSWWGVTRLVMEFLHAFFHMLKMDDDARKGG